MTREELEEKTKDLRFSWKGEPHKAVDVEQWARLARTQGKDLEWAYWYILAGYPEPPRWLF